MKKTEQFLKDLAKEYHKNGRNISLAYKTLRPNVKDNTAEVEGSRALRNPKFVNELQELEEKSKLRYDIDMQELVNDLKEIKKIGVNEIPIIGGKEGEVFGYKREDLNASLKAVDMLIKVAGEYAPVKSENKNTNLNTDVVIDIED
jgi:hypothetical protein